MFRKSLFNKNLLNSFENLDLTQNFEKMSKIFDLSEKIWKINILVEIVQNIDLSNL